MPGEQALPVLEYRLDLKKYMKSLQYKLSGECIKSFTYQMLNGPRGATPTASSTAT